jgi:acyl carrier protein
MDDILQIVFGTKPGEIAPEQTFAEDLMAESLDYVDIGLHVAQRFGIPFDFAEAAEEMRAAGVERIRVADLLRYIERRLGDGTTRTDS